jgi:hypothetical protein
VLQPLHPVHRCCASALAGIFALGAVAAVGLGACGSVKQDSVADAALTIDAKQLRSCVAPPSITPVESAEPGYGNSCIHGVWTLQAFNGLTMPLAVGHPNNITDVAPVPIMPDPKPLDSTSTFAIHVSGSGQENTGTASAYAQLTASLNTLSITDVGTVDASAYTGIQFQAMLSAGATGARLTVGTLFSDPAGGKCVEGGANGTGCFDNPGAQLAVSGMTWTLYRVEFAGLQPLGFGLSTPRDSIKNAITHIKWDIGIPSTGPTPQWDLWVDDVTFY